MTDAESSGGLSYASAGVSIDAGNRLVDLIKPLAKSTARSGCAADLGGFGGLFDLKEAGYNDPVLIMGTDGVGTKLKVAQACGVHDTVGQDLVAMCVNDILAHGAEPLAYLDYFACGKLDVDAAKQVVSGIADGCRMAGCALLGGETAEMPSFYASGEYDLAGFAVGAVEREQLLRESPVQAGDVVIGVASSGVHSNGFSLVRRVVADRGLSYADACPFQAGTTLGRALLAPTVIYVRGLLPVLRDGRAKAFAHITGGGLLENIPRVLPAELAVRLDAAKWSVPPVFRWLASGGGGCIAAREMARTFNCGLGAVVIASPENADGVVAALRAAEHPAWRVGRVESRAERTEQVLIDNIERLTQPLADLPVATTANQAASAATGKRVAVLISGSGTNLQAIIDDLAKPCNGHARLVLVLSNKPDVQGLERAHRAGVATQVISHKGFKDRAEYDEKLHEALVAANTEIVVLAGFMRILTEGFVTKWQGRMLNIHPSLLPSFRGHNAHEQVLAAGVRVSGCTVHFVEPEVDAGGIIVQETVAVEPHDSLEDLQQRVKAVEHRAYPDALRLLATGKVRRGDDGRVIFS